MTQIELFYIFAKNIPNYIKRETRLYNEAIFENVSLLKSDDENEEMGISEIPELIKSVSKYLEASKNEKEREK